MKTHTKQITSFRFLVIIFTALLNIWICGGLYAETVAGTTEFFINHTLKFPGSYSILLNAENNIFEINSCIKTKEPLPKFKIVPAGLSVRFSPLLYGSPKKYYPALSFFFGNLHYAAFLKDCSNPAFPVQKPSSSGIQFFPKNFIKCSASGNYISKAVEFSLNNFNLFLLAEQKEKAEKPRFHVSAAYKTQDINGGNTSLACNFYSVFFPNAYSEFDSTYKNYNSLYSGIFLFSTETYYGDYAFMCLGSLSLSYKTAKPLLASRMEFNFFKDYAGFDAGFSLEQKNFLGLKGKTQKEHIAFFFRPQFITRLFKINTIYNFSADYKEREKKHFSHSGGFDFKIGNLNYLFKTYLFYEKELWNLKSDFSIKKVRSWQELFLVGCTFNFEHKKKNPFIIKSYAVNTEFKINCGKFVKLGITGNVSQKNIVVSKKKQPSIFEWKKPDIESSLYIEAAKKINGFSHSIKSEFKFTNIKPFVYFSLGYKIKK